MLGGSSSSSGGWKARPPVGSGCCARLQAWFAPVNVRQVIVIAVVNILCFAIVLALMAPAATNSNGSPNVWQPTALLAPMHGELQRQQQLQQQLAPGIDTPQQPVILPAVTSAPVTAVSAAPLRDAIVGMASNVQFEFLYHFVRSARTYCPSCTILLLMPTADSSPERVTSLLRYFDVEVFNYDALLAGYTAKQRAFHPSSTRWMLLHDLLASWPASRRYNALMLTDVRDTVFQRDPFQALRIGHHSTVATAGSPAELPRLGVWFAMENAAVPIVSDGWNRGWIADCYGEEMIARVGQKGVSCSGTTLATWDEAKLYVRLMSDAIREHEACERNGIDQGVHNVILHTGALPSAHPGLSVYQESTERGLIATVQSMPTLRRNEYGFVVNDVGDTVAIVHQVDRSAHLIRQFEQQFPIIPEHERRQK